MPFINSSVVERDSNNIKFSEAHNCSHQWVSLWLHTGHLYISGHKMSKSLKNFISIESYLKSNSDDDYWTTRPALDMRVFCLLNKYNTNVHFTKERLHEAGKARERIETFLNLFSKIIDPSFSPSSSYRIDRKSTPESRALGQSLDECKLKISDALRNDFDTPTAMKELLHVITIGLTLR
jgi:cysteinyl-tRNA synthetase